MTSPILLSPGASDSAGPASKLFWRPIARPIGQTNGKQREEEDPREEGESTGGKSSSVENAGHRAEITSGVFRGNCMRFEFGMAQEPIHGRRKTEKDRRPLAHCPIARMKIFQYDTAREEEEEIDVSTIEPTCFVCSAELYTPSRLPYISEPPKKRKIKNVEPGEEPEADDGLGYLSLTPSFQALASPRKTGASDEEESGSDSRPRKTRRLDSVESYTSHVADDGFPQKIIEVKKGKHKETPTRNLFGSLHVPGVRVPAMEGGMGLWFAFPDLSVRQEGSYTLRFRCFDITAVLPGSAIPIRPLSQCFSQVFQVYSPRNFPGMPKLTELAEHFARQGFKLNTRKSERSIKSPNSRCELEPESSNKNKSEDSTVPSQVRQYVASERTSQNVPCPLAHPAT
ncbi:hypothetical protein P7C73_g3255, partial [Tremellales sp. Uapishka_1]